MQKNKNYLLLLLRGCAMGAADVIPGVSGGTIAFITGIYEELINSIRSINLQALRMLFILNLKGFWKHINGNFLISIIIGIAVSIFSLAKLMKYLLETHPIFIWSFFFGLIIASTFLVYKEVKKWDIFTIFSLLFGVVTAYTITILTPTNTPETWWFILLSGAIAVCAMILPGISGAFILLLLGKYAYIITAASEFNIGVLLIFLLGAVIGIITFSHLLSWLLKNYHGLTVALLTGFMIGSLNKIWPWKIINTEFINGADFTIEENVLPGTFEHQGGGDPLILQAILMCLIGFFLIWGIEKIAAVSTKK